MDTASAKRAQELSDSGDHDEAIDYAQTEAIVGVDTAKALKDATIGLYTKAADYALSHGIIIADTKFVFQKKFRFCIGFCTFAPSKSYP